MKAVGRLHERLETPRTGGAGTARYPPTHMKITKTNLRSAVESTKGCKNEPRTNLNEPKPGAPRIAQVF